MTTRYDWSRAPEWARYAAMDADGDVFWYENEPAVHRVHKLWADRGGKVELANNAVLDWKASLETRP